MKNNRLLFFSLFMLGIVFFTSCASTHPNSKLIVGKWKPESVEKYIDPNSTPEPQAATTTTQAGASAAQPVKVKPGDSSKSAGRGGAQAGQAGQKKDAALDRLIRAEQRADFEVFPNGTAVKMYYPKAVKAKWKMNGKGNRVVVKGAENNRKFVIDIVEITNNRCVLIERTDAGDLKITYLKQ